MRTHAVKTVESSMSLVGYEALRTDFSFSLSKERSEGLRVVLPSKGGGGSRGAMCSDREGWLELYMRGLGMSSGSSSSPMLRSSPGNTMWPSILLEWAGMPTPLYACLKCPEPGGTTP
jgi:hypothetical protein